MKKPFLGTLAVLTIAFTLQAVPVTPNATRTVAANFWNTYHPLDVKAVAPEDLTLMTYGDLPYLNVYTYGDQGFVVVSADDRAIPVPAYSFDSPFPEELNPAVRYWLNIYNAQIAEAVEHDIPSTAADEWHTLLTATPPDMPKLLINIPAMLTTKWNQSDPYNRHCPYDTVLHARSVVGCVATAMAQLMKYWNHPSCGTGSHSFYSDADYSSYAYGTLSADFANTTYIWAYMPNMLSSFNTSTEINAVATLSYHCGVAVEMMYSPEGSGAYTISYGNPNFPSSERALREYFRYSRDLHGEQRYHFNDSVWCAMIDTDVVAGRPILYTGHDNSGGHAFVLDGADSTGRYHFNLGWGGSGDAYYTINNIAPGGGGAGGNSTYTFNEGQTAVFGVVPIPQHFDTVNIFDTICPGDASYDFFEYSFYPSAGTKTVVHLETVYNIHLAKAPSRHAYLDPNGGEGSIRTITFCPTRGLILPENTFSREGWEFRGWCLDLEGHDIVYQPGDTIPLRVNKFVYALWHRPGTNSIATTGEDNISVWPRVANECINLCLPTGATVTVVDTYGRVVLEKRTAAGEAKISLESMPAGTYTVLVTTDKSRYNTRIIKL